MPGLNPDFPIETSAHWSHSLFFPSSYRRMRFQILAWSVGKEKKGKKKKKKERKTVFIDHVTSSVDNVAAYEEVSSSLFTEGQSAASTHKAPEKDTVFTRISAALGTKKLISEALE